MKYTSDIYELPLSVFIDVYTNKDSRVEWEDEDKDAARARVINDYMEIVGGKMLEAEIMGGNERMNLMMTVECMKACENLMRLGKHVEVCGLLQTLGYSCKTDDAEGIKSRIAALKSRARYDLDKLDKEKMTEVGEKPTKRSFVNEVVAIGKYNKMHINLNEWTAGAYACLVKQTCEEIEVLNRKRK